MGSAIKGIAINDFTFSSSISTTLVANIANPKDKLVFIFVEVKDSQGGISNTTTSVTVAKSTLNTKTIKSTYSSFTDILEKISYLQILAPRIFAVENDK
jgi:hypothetical protein